MAQKLVNCACTSQGAARGALAAEMYLLPLGVLSHIH